MPLPSPACSIFWPGAHVKACGSPRAVMSILTGSRPCVHRVKQADGPFRSPLEEPDDVAILVQIDLPGIRRRRQPGHGSHLAEERIQEPRAEGRPHLSDGHPEAVRAS